MSDVTNLYDHVDDHLQLTMLVRQLVPAVESAGAQMWHRLNTGGVLYTCGNGGSAADAQHLAAEMIGRYLRERRALPAVALTTDPSVMTCIANDYDYEETFARQLSALATDRDLLVGFTTSGRSRSVIRAFETARELGVYTIAFTGAAGLPVHADQVFAVPSNATARVQEMHLMLLHLLSEHIDAKATHEPKRA